MDDPPNGAAPLGHNFRIAQHLYPNPKNLDSPEPAGRRLTVAAAEKDLSTIYMKTAGTANRGTRNYGAVFVTEVGLSTDPDAYSGIIPTLHTLEPARPQKAKYVYSKDVQLDALKDTFCDIRSGPNTPFIVFKLVDNLTEDTFYTGVAPDVGPNSGFGTKFFDQAVYDANPGAGALQPKRTSDNRSVPGALKAANESTSC